MEHESQDDALKAITNISGKILPLVDNPDIHSAIALIHSMGATQKSCRIFIKSWTHL